MADSTDKKDQPKDQAGQQTKDQPKPAWPVNPARPQRATEPAEPPPEGRLVILHTMVGQFTQGQVVDAAAFGDQANVRRLLSIGAVRQPTEEEEAHDRVTILQPGTHHPSAEAKLAQAQTEADRLKQQNADLEKQLNEYRAKDADRVAMAAGKEADAKRQSQAAP
jgi:hypothetical protein